ncbi:MAG: hypothetical protein RLZ44_544, partial [Pseudomonadota bacterium]
QLLLTRGFASAPAGRLAPFGYFSVVFAMLLGWLFWDEGVTPGMLLGTLLIVAAGLLASRRGRLPRAASATPLAPAQAAAKDA